MDYTWVSINQEILTVVIEYCKHGPVMDIGLDKKATPYPPEQARNLFRDLILGMEYRITLESPINSSSRTGYCPS